MKRLMIAAASIMTVCSTSASAEPLNSWLGDWVGVNDDDLPELSIRRQGDDIFVSAAGNCSPTNCQWGEVQGAAYASSAAGDLDADTDIVTASWNQGFGVGTLILRYGSSGTIQATFLREFTDGSGRTNYRSISRLQRPRPVLNPGIIGTLPNLGDLVVRPVATLSFSEDCIGFDHNQVTVERHGGRWKLVQGSMWMLDAGPNRLEMLRARNIVQHYDFNRQCFIGRPDASVEYWLTASGAPSGALSGEDCVSIDPNALSVRNSGSHFTVVSGGNHFAFTAPSQAEANQIVELVQHYGFTRSCFVGRPDPSMRYLRR